MCGRGFGGFVAPSRRGHSPRLCSLSRQRGTLWGTLSLGPSRVTARSSRDTAPVHCATRGVCAPASGGRCPHAGRAPNQVATADQGAQASAQVRSLVKAAPGTALARRLRALVAAQSAAACASTEALYSSYISRRGQMQRDRERHISKGVPKVATFGLAQVASKTRQMDRHLQVTPYLESRISNRISNLFSLSLSLSRLCVCVCV